jgi:hypothetical protein
MAVSGILLVVALGFGASAVRSATADRLVTVPRSQVTAPATPHVATSSTAAPSATSAPFESLLVIESGPDVLTVISSLGAVAAILVAVAQWVWPRRPTGPLARWLRGR